jgi:GntR family transcriptional regulator of vanillate catabolism
MTADGSQTGTAVLGLREMVLDGRLAAGDALVEAQLVATLKVSRTPVRAALARLEAEGLLTRGPRGGYVVRSFSLQDVADAIELRGTLEGMAARVCARDGIGRRHRADLERCLDELDDVVGRSVGPVDLAAYIPLNVELHRLLVEAAANQGLTAAIERVTALPFASPSAFVAAQAELGRSHQILVRAQAQHRAIVTAVLAGDVELAESSAREHAGLALENLDLARHPTSGASDALHSVPGMALVRPA